MRIERILGCAVVCASALIADSLVLKSGRVVEGSYVGGDSRTVKMLSDDRVQTFDLSEVRSLQFGSAGSERSSRPAHSESGALSPAAPATNAGPAPSPRRSMSGAEPQRAAHGVTVPAGSNLVVRLIDDVDSERDSVGKTYRASLDESVMVDGLTAVPKNSDVLLKLVDDKQAGRLTGKTVLTLDVDSIVVDGRSVEVQTQEITQESKSQTAQTGKMTAGVAALGAVIGGIAGGGKGAAIGAVSGAAVGAGSQVLLKGQRVRVPSETRLTFSLQQPVRL